MVGWADIDGSVVGSQWERVHRLALIDELLHGAAVGLVCDPSVLLAVKVHNHKVEGVGWRFRLFCFGGRFCDGGPRVCAHGRSRGSGSLASYYGYEDGCSSGASMVTSGRIGPVGGYGRGCDGVVVISL